MADDILPPEQLLAQAKARVKPPNFDAMPVELMDILQWCLWNLELSKKNKKGEKKVTKIPYQICGTNASSTDPLTWASFADVKAAYEKGGFDGIGFFFNDDYTGFDFDHCRNVSGEILDPLVISVLKRLDSYPEISQSCTGMHCIIKGTLKDDPKKKSGGCYHTRTIRLIKYEFYSNGRFFVMTGNTPDTLCISKEIREDQAAIDEVYDTIMNYVEPESEADEATETMLSVASDSANPEDRQLCARIISSKHGTKFLRLMNGNISGYPSESEADGGLAGILGFWTRKNYEQTLRIIKTSKLWDEKWEREDYQQNTIQGAFDKLEDVRATHASALQPVDWALGYFVNKVGETRIGKFNDKKENIDELVSQGYAYLKAILEDLDKSPVERYYLIGGKGLSSSREFELTVKIADFADPRVVRKVLLSEWAEDNIGKMELGIIQALSPRPVKHCQILTRPAWVHDELIAPGLAKNETIFKLSPKVAVNLPDGVGDIATGKEALRKALLAFDPKNTTLLFATVLGAPIIAKLWPGDRYCLFLQATTQYRKTTAAVLFQSIFGADHSNESRWVRWGAGSTSNAAGHIAAKTGPFAFLLDNYKQYTDKDPSEIQKFIHALLEGTEKDRMVRSDNETRQSDEYLCTPIVTGEQYPGNDSATRARVIELQWTDAIDLEYLSYAQAHLEDLNAFGRAWLLWLNLPEGRAAMDKAAAWFGDARIYYLKAGGIGRVASNAAVISLVWEIFNQWPEGHALAEEFSESFGVAINEHIIRAQSDITDQLDAQKFVDWLRAELFVGRYYLTGKAELMSGAIAENVGWFATKDLKEKRPDDEVRILPEVLKAKLLPAWQKTTNGTRTDARALLRQLVSCGYLEYDNQEKRFTMGREIDKKTTRVHVFKRIFEEDGKRLPGDERNITKLLVMGNRYAPPVITGISGITDKNGKCVREERENQSPTNKKTKVSDSNTHTNNTGNTGNTGNISLTDSGFDITKPLPVLPVEGKDFHLVPVAHNGDKQTVQFKTDYSSDWHGAMRLFKEGEIVEIPAERASSWIKRGIVVAVTAC